MWNPHGFVWKIWKIIYIYGGVGVPHLCSFTKGGHILGHLGAIHITIWLYMNAKPYWLLNLTSPNICLIVIHPFFFGYMDFIHCSIASFRRDSLWSLNSLLCKIHMNIVGKSVTSRAWPGAKYWGHGFRPLRTAGACHCLALCSPVDAKWWAGPVTPGAPPLTLPQRGHNFGPSTSQFCVQCGAPKL